MIRRRRRSSVRSAYSRGGGNIKLILLGFLAVVFLGGLTYFIHVADSMKPERREIRVELSHALAN